MIKTLTYYGIKYEKYKITSDGKLIGSNGKVLKTQLTKDKRETVVIRPFGRKGECICIYIHKAVAQNFLKKEDGKSEIHHIDKNSLNNDYLNLMWVTPEEHDALHSNDFQIGGDKYHTLRNGEDCFNSKLTNEDIEYIRSNYKSRDSEFGARALGRKYGISHSTISKIVNKVSWKHI